MTALSTPLVAAARPLALLWFPIASAGLVTGLYRRLGSLRGSMIAALVGALPAFVILGAVLETLRVDLPPIANAVVFLLVWALTGSTIGYTVARSVTERSGGRLFAARVLGVMGATAAIAIPMFRLLGSAADTSLRLAWILGEEDNAQIVGVAREILMRGPNGAELAEQFGTSFVSLPLAILDLAGGPLASETDPRLQAITLFTISTLVIIVLAGLAMASLIAVPTFVHEPREARRVPERWSSSVVGGVAAAAAALVAFSLLVVLPMRTGFLTFVWGLTLVLSAATVVAITPQDASKGHRTVVLAHLAGVAILLFGSWPFIGPALIAIGLIPVSWLPWGQLRAIIREQRVGAALGSVAMLAAISAAMAWFLRTGPGAEVLSYGRRILTDQASGIFADPITEWAALVSLSIVTLALATRYRGASRLVMLAAIVGPAAGATALYLALRAAAGLLTDGVLGYAGIKLWYAIVVLAMVLGLTALVGEASRRGPVIQAGVAAASALVLLLAPTAGLFTEWGTRTYQPDTTHSPAVIDAIASSSPDLPIRCLPSPGTSVTEQTRLAAYFCIRWMEDAFNDDRSHGHRSAMLEAEGPTFEPVIERILDEDVNDYLFAYRMTMGPGWFGWTG